MNIRWPASIPVADEQNTLRHQLTRCNYEEIHRTYR